MGHAAQDLVFDNVAPPDTMDDANAGKDPAFYAAKRKAESEDIRRRVNEAEVKHTERVGNLMQTIGMSEGEVQGCWELFVWMDKASFHLEVSTVYLVDCRTRTGPLQVAK